MKKPFSSKYEDMKNEVEKIAYRYFVCKRDAAKERLAGNNSVQTLSPFLFYINRVHESFRSLSSTEQDVLNNDFFYQNYEDWWEGQMNKKNYLKTKVNALRKFLNHFYEVD